MWNFHTHQFFFGKFKKFAGVGKRNETEKTENFQKRNETEKNYKIKKRNETESHRKRNEM
jgi:hypothetical protein